MAVCPRGLHSLAVALLRVGGGGSSLSAVGGSARRAAGAAGVLELLGPLGWGVVHGDRYRGIRRARPGLDGLFSQRPVYGGAIRRVRRRLSLGGLRPAGHVAGRPSGGPRRRNPQLRGALTYTPPLRVAARQAGVRGAGVVGG